MALTRDFKATVSARVRNNPVYAQALLDETHKTRCLLCLLSVVLLPVGTAVNSASHSQRSASL